MNCEVTNKMAAEDTFISNRLVCNPASFTPSLCVIAHHAIYLQSRDGYKRRLCWNKQECILNIDAHVRSLAIGREGQRSIDAELEETCAYIVQITRLTLRNN